MLTTPSPASTGGGFVPPEDVYADPDEEEPRRFAPLLTWIGAAASIAIILGVSIWTYRLGQRDAMDVPIVRAMEGPARVVPEDPGGATIAHQGLSVNRVLEGGGAREVAATVTTAPGADGVLSEDKAADDLVALVEAKKPTARPLVRTGSPEENAILASVAIDDILEIAHANAAAADKEIAERLEGVGTPDTAPVPDEAASDQETEVAEGNSSGEPGHVK